MRKILSFFTILSVMLAFAPALAKQDKANYAPDSEVATEDGVYDVAGHPELKVRVFVYKAKPAPSPVLTLSCNLSDPPSTAVDAPAGWTLPSSWTYNLNSSSVPASVGGNYLPTIASNAFSAWTSALGGKVTVSKGANTSATRAVRDYQNIIAWGRTSGSALAVTYTWYNTTTKKAVEIDTIMNLKFPWAWSDPASWGSQPTCAYNNVYDAQNILTHELGHTFGLDDHYTSSYANNTMYGYGSKTETKKNTLTQGDIAGVQALY